MTRLLSLARALVWRVRIPLDVVYVSSMYIMDATVRTIVALETAEGIVGVGEAPGAEEVYGLVCRLVRESIGQDLLNRNGRQHDFARSVFDNRNGRHGWSALAAVDMACWDATAKAYGLPLARLLGGDVRRRIAVVCPLPATMLDTPISRQSLLAEFADLGKVAKVVEYACREAETRGFRCFKYKSAGVSAEWDVAVMRSLRNALPATTELRFDPNAAYPPAHAVGICRRLDDLGLEFYEDPADGLEGLAAVRRRTRTPVATNMAVIQPDHLAPAIRDGAVDVVLADIFTWGGIGAYRGLAAVAETFGLEIAVHSLFETGLGAALNLQLAAGLPQIRRATDSGLHVLRHQAARDALTREPLTVRDGAMDVPAGPGLGMVLDREALTDCSIDHVAIGR